MRKYPPLRAPAAVLDLRAWADFSPTLGQVRAGFFSPAGNPLHSPCVVPSDGSTFRHELRTPWGDLIIIEIPSPKPDLPVDPSPHWRLEARCAYYNARSTVRAKHALVAAEKAGEQGGESLVSRAG